MRLSKKALSLIMGIVLITATSTSVRATTNNNELENNNAIYSEITDSELQTFFDENSVPKEKQSILREKVEKNILWDCYETEKINNIPEDFSYFDINNKSKEKYYRFEDGSFIKISVNSGEVKNIKTKDDLIKYNIEPGNRIMPRKVVSDSFGSLYTNHKIQRSVGLTSAYFYANFYVSNPYYGGFSRIYTDTDGIGYNSPFGLGASGFGLDGNPNGQLIRAVEDRNSSQAAMFRMYWFNKKTVSGSWAGISGNAPIGSTCNLYLALIRGNMYVDSKLPF